MSSSLECSICVEPFNKASRKHIACLHCKLECCTSCTKTYLQTSGVSPQCMQCHRPWSHQYIRETFGPAFVKKITNIQKDVLFTEQLTLLPYTQEYVNLQERYDKLVKDECEINDRIEASIKTINELYRKIEATKLYKINQRQSYRFVMKLNEYIKDKIDPTDDEKQFSETLDSFSRLRGDESRKRSERYSVFRQLSRIRNPERYSHDERPSFIDSQSSLKTYLKPCGKNECKGYVNKTDCTCEICKTVFCVKCLEEKNDAHECKEEDILTVNMLRKDSKNCPGCATLIHRISGCPDMFCVSCKTAFNWNTMEINRRGNSNPHYYQWLRENTQEGMDDDSTTPECGRELNTYDAIRSENFRNMTFHQQDTITNILQRLHHYERGYNASTAYKDYHKTRHNDFHIVTLQNRADYMRNKISESKFKQLILRSNKAKEYNSNITEIISSIREFRQVLLQTIRFSTPFNYDRFLKDSTNFINYINDCVYHLDKVYYNKTHRRDFIAHESHLR